MSEGIHGNETDHLALLQFKADVVDPLRVLSSWNSSHHYCQWYGVTCGRRHQRVAALDLRSLHLLGNISPSIGNMSFLRVLVLQNNSFHSRIPLEVGHLSRLQVLHLNNNLLDGPIPSSLSNCSNLVSINLGHNRLLGPLPVDIGSLSKLKFLSLELNNLSGVIPPSVGNLSTLEQIWMSINNIYGRIPDTLANLRNLTVLAVAENNLTGNLPSSVTNISTLVQLDLGYNQLVGILPWNLGTILPSLQFFSVARNHFTGPIPKSVSNMSNIRVFQISLNAFSGDVPSLRKMSNLLKFNIYGNHLGSAQAGDLTFFCSLTNSSNIHWLDVSHNKFGGAIPECIGNLSTTLETLLLQDNAFSGPLPSSIGNLISLEYFLLWYNNISGPIPPEIGNLKNMKQLHLGFCEFTGQIPHTLGNLTQMTHLSLRENNLLGAIPPSLCKCQSLLLLDLGHNNLNGAIPCEIISLSSLSIYADFSNNNLEGELPVEIGNLKNLGQLNLSWNKFSGEIPSSLGSSLSLQNLFMQENMFTGPIPSTLSSLKGIQILNLSHNGLTGPVPEFLVDLDLISLDLSFNSFEGNLPTEGVFANTSATSVLGNEKLCGGLPEYQLPKCKFTGSNNHRVRYIFIYVGSGILAILMVLFFLYFLLHKKEREIVDSGFSNDDLLKISYQDLVKATEGFSSSNLIGSGTFGSVFRGVLGLDQATIAVKVLNLAVHGALKSFVAECEVLRNVRHRNLVKIVTACVGSDYQGNDFKALIYEFMANGSLEEWLHPQIEISRETEDVRRQLSLLQRVNIAIDVACSLDYLHHQCETPIIHCDLKPSNILLDGDMNGHVGDFGLVRFLRESTQEFIINQTSSVGVRGSLGYIAPGDYLKSCPYFFPFI